MGDDQPAAMMTVAAIAVPSRLQLTSDTAAAWKAFKQKFDLYMLASGYSKKTDEEKVALLLTVGGDDLIEIYNAFEWAAEGDDKNYKKVTDKLNSYFSPRSNELSARYMFATTKQKEEESLEGYITRLKILSRDCEFGDHKEKNIRDRVVFGVNDDYYNNKGSVRNVHRQQSPYRFT